MTRIGSKQLWRVLTVVTAFLLTVSVAAMAILTEYATMINGALNITNIRMEETGDGSEDTVRFKSGFSTMEELLAHQTALSRELEAEGAVLLKNEGGLLPLAQSASVSLFSRSSVDVAYGDAAIVVLTRLGGEDSILGGRNTGSSKGAFASRAAGGLCQDQHHRAQRQ